MGKIQSGAAISFIVVVALLTLVSIFGVWDIVTKDVIGKSFQTLGLLAIIAVIVIVAGRYMETHNAPENNLPPAPNPIFTTIRKTTLNVLILASSVLGLVGILVIWDVIDNKEILHKVFSSIAIIIFSSLLVVMTCASQEGNDLIQKNKNVTFGTVILVFIVAWILFKLLLNSLFW